MAGAILERINLITARIAVNAEPNQEWRFARKFQDDSVWRCQLNQSGVKPALILCIDDDDIVLRVRKLLLGSEGYNVITANSGGEGLELFKQNPIGLVIADHFLSDETGAEISRAMKQLKPDVPILIISAAMEKPDGLEFADGFLAKGEPANVQLDTIAHLLAGRHPGVGDCPVDLRR